MIVNDFEANLYLNSAVIKKNLTFWDMYILALPGWLGQVTCFPCPRLNSNGLVYPLKASWSCPLRLATFHT